MRIAERELSSLTQVRVGGVRILKRDYSRLKAGDIVMSQGYTYEVGTTTTKTLQNKILAMARYKAEEADARRRFMELKIEIALKASGVNLDESDEEEEPHTKKRIISSSSSSVDDEVITKKQTKRRKNEKKKEIEKDDFEKELAIIEQQMTKL